LPPLRKKMQKKKKKPTESKKLKKNVFLMPCECLEQQLLKEMIFPSFSVTETNTLPSLIEIG
jgi:hypothetical protein